MYTARKTINSVREERLLEISQERHKLDLQLSNMQKLGVKQVSAILDRMADLRAERESILQLSKKEMSGVEKQSINWHNTYVSLGLNMKVYEQIKNGEVPDFIKDKRADSEILSDDVVSNYPIPDEVNNVVHHDKFQVALIELFSRYPLDVIERTIHMLKEDAMLRAVGQTKSIDLEKMLDNWDSQGVSTCEIREYLDSLITTGSDESEEASEIKKRPHY